MSEESATKFDSEKIRLELLPPELLFGVGEILTFGAKKYSIEEFGNLWDAVNPIAIDLYIAKVCAVRITKNNSGKIILSMLRDKEKTAESGEKIILTESYSWLDIARMIRNVGGEIKPQKEDFTLKVLESQKLMQMKSYEEAVKYVDQPNTFTLITTMKQGNSEVYFVANTTTVWDSLVMTLRGLKPHLPISDLKPKTGDRNWEKGMDWSRVFGAMMRHMWAWWRGQDKDPETGKSHLWHAGCCIAFLIAYEERGIGKDDRPV